MKKQPPKRALPKTGKLEPRAHQSRRSHGLVQFLAASPLAKAKIDLKRKHEFARKIGL